MSQEPAFLNLKQSVALLGVSERTFHQLRKQGLIPPPLELGPRCLRWPRAELIDSAIKLAPRQTTKAEPPQLTRAREARKAGQ